MRRSVSNLLGLAAVTATLALGIPALSTAASASTAQAASASGNPYWGPYWSANRLAKANGYIDVYWDGDTSNSVRIKGTVWDLDDRTQHQGGKCAYVRFRFQDLDDADDSSPTFKSYTHCGSGGHKDFNVARHDLATVQVQVCQIGLGSRHPSQCGYWYWLGGDRLNKI